MTDCDQARLKSPIHSASERFSDAYALPQCEVCGVSVTAKPTGRPRRYCSGRCKAKAHRCRIVITWLRQIEAINLDFEKSLKIDWSDEDHRVV